MHKAGADPIQSQLYRGDATLVLMSPSKLASLLLVGRDCQLLSKARFIVFKNRVDQPYQFHYLYQKHSLAHYLF